MIKQYTKKTDGKKYYMFQLYLGKDEITKKDRYTTRRGFKTKKEAEIAQARLKTEIADNGLLNTDITTFKEIYELWYEGYQPVSYTHLRQGVLFQLHHHNYRFSLLMKLSRIYSVARAVLLLKC